MKTFKIRNFEADSSGSDIEEVKGYTVKGLCVEAFAYRPKEGGWSVSEVTTGMCIRRGRYAKKMVISMAREMLEAIGDETVLETVAKNIELHGAV